MAPSTGVTGKLDCWIKNGADLYDRLLFLRKRPPDGHSNRCYKVQQFNAKQLTTSFDFCQFFAAVPVEAAVGCP
jgi:hypothetical protein